MEGFRRSADVADCNGRCHGSGGEPKNFDDEQVILSDCLLDGDVETPTDYRYIFWNGI
jgi:hypothetical protein